MQSSSPSGRPTHTIETIPISNRPDRPCDACRRRKTRCVVQDSGLCVLCEFHNQTCTFVDNPVPRKRKATSPSIDDDQARHRRSLSNGQTQPPTSNVAIRTNPVIDDYANLQGQSLLKKTLGLQNHRHAKYIGPTSTLDATLLDLRLYDAEKGESPFDSVSSSIRRVGPADFFHQVADDTHNDHAKEMAILDQIERLVAPYGQSLIRLYFRIIHPSYPILHKKVYLEKYGRTHREFSPPLLAAVYILALNWWAYSPELSKHTKPDVSQLEILALQSLYEVSLYRPKLSTVQAGLLLLQRQSGSDECSWQLVSLIVGVAQDLGLHRDCSNWRIPVWEKGLRKRLAWAFFMQDTWSAMIFGRPTHVSMNNWAVQNVVGKDFPENAADEGEEEGSVEIDKGRAIFCAMIELTKILHEILNSLYSLKTEAELADSGDSAQRVLAMAKPIQLKLRSWFTDLPDLLRIDVAKSKTGKLSSVGYLHLAYFAAEIILHRRVIRSLSHRTDAYVVSICRSAAQARLTGAIEMFDKFKPDHLQSFWFFASKHNLASIGMFAGLCLVTSTGKDEADFYRQRLQEYCWSLKVSNKSAEFVEGAHRMLELAIGDLVSRSTEGDEKHHISIPLMQHRDEAEDDLQDWYGFDHSLDQPFSTFINPQNE